MSAHVFGTPPTEADLVMLESCGIPRQVAELEDVRHIDSATGAEMFGRRDGKDYEGVLFTNRWPGREDVREYGLRRDNPDPVVSSDGSIKYGYRYVLPPGRRNLLWFSRRTRPEWLEDTGLPVLIVEGQKKLYATAHLGWHGKGDAAEQPRWLPVGLTGVYNWRGTVEKIAGKNGQRRNAKGPIPDLDHIVWTKREVVLLFDSDVHSNEQVQIARNWFAKELRGRGAKIRFADIPEDLGLKGIDDVIGQVGPERALEIIQSAYDPKHPAWRKRLLRTEGGEIKSCLENFSICLSQHPDWQDGLCYDEFRNVVCVTDFAPGGIQRGPLDDHAVIDIRRWCERYFLTGNDEKIRAAIDAAARAYRFHPLREYIKNCKRDDVTRVPTFFQTYFGASDRDDNDTDKVDKYKATYLSSVATMWGVSAIARIFKPGCQVDHLLVLEGPQGIYKSQALQALFGAEYFCDQMPHLADKDSSLQLRGKWCLELGEFDRMARYDSSTLKAFLTRQVDVYRKSYGRQTVDVPRQCIFAATVNPPEYLVDEENRRAWPVACTWVDVEKLRRDRNLIWAEFYELYRKGTKWWPTGDELRKLLMAEQEKREIENPYYGSVVEWIRQQTKTQGWATVDILKGLDIRIEQYKSVDQHVAKVMRKLGYKKLRPDPNEPRRWFLKINKA
jgi:hypothetical protein